VVKIQGHVDAAQELRSDHLLCACVDECVAGEGRLIFGWECRRGGGGGGGGGDGDAPSAKRLSYESGLAHGVLVPSGCAHRRATERWWREGTPSHEHGPSARYNSGEIQAKIRGPTCGRGNKGKAFCCKACTEVCLGPS